ncbi:hypothetical protein PYW07_015801 [Mythimna separata]|uniref:Reverse transcriptase domain-containing protein n=1 Tax=Mythimna separata TaxID=271217 RepID=A0AAD8DVL0_MYTSE|nr:hypothetical protein PYW07_015801 [Mythimna separata]
MQKKNKNITLMGDFNAKLGGKSNKDEFVLGDYSSGDRNDNGHRLIDFAFEHNLRIMNSFFKKRKSKKWTWMSPNGKDKNEIDFILSRKKHTFRDVDVVNKINFNTDHRMVRGVIQYGNEKSRKHIINATRNTIAPIPQKVLNELEDKLKQIEGTTTPQEKYNFLEKELIKLNKSRSKNVKKNKLGEETLNLMEERKKMLEKRKDNKENISIISKKIQSSIRKHRKSERLKVLREQIEKTGGIKKGLKELREYTQWIPNIKTKSKKKNEKLTTKRPLIAKVATDFYRKLYTNTDESIQTETEKEGYEEIPGILESEVIKAIKTQKSGKAPGDDKITNEILRESLIAISKCLTNLFNEIMTTEQIPIQWTKSTIVLLHKKGDKNEINNYRPICLMSNLYKVFSKIILGRITKQLEENQPREQAGFRADYSTIDHIHVVKQIIEKLNEFGQLYYMAFVDYNKAFDSLSHNYIWKTLENQGVDKKYIQIIKKIYRNITATVQLEQQGKEFSVQRGVRQGDPLSPKLFTAVLENIFRHLDWDNFGININGLNLNHLRFADDIVIFAKRPDILQTMLEQLDLESKKAGLSMNPMKTKIMTNGLREGIEIGQEVIEYVDEYIYLGQLISTKDQHSKEINRRISNTWKRYWSLKEIVKNETIPMSIKSKLYNTCILPCLTYGCQTWPATIKSNKSLVVCQRSMERSMLNIRLQDRWTIAKIRKRTKVTDVLQKIRKLKWNWTGHIMRTDSGRKWTKDVMEWYPRNGKRQKGRQVKRWEDDLPKGWRRIARDRDEWKVMGEAYVKRQPD